MRLVFAVFSVPVLVASLAHGATHKGIKHSSLRDDKRDFDDEENESLSKGTLRHTHRRGILCDQKKYLNAKKDVSGEFFFPSFLGFY